MKRFFILVLGLLLAGQMYSQEKTDAMLFGHVTSAKTKEHIPFSTIIIKGTKSGTTADVTGHFKMANLPLGQITIIVQSMGYKTQEQVVTMERGKTSELYVELEDDILNLEQVVITGT